jgi:hypothetical protein
MVKIGLNGGHFEKMAAIFGVLYLYLLLGCSNGLGDPQNLGIATKITTLGTLWAEIWSKLVLNVGHFEKWPPCFFSSIFSELST